MDLPITGAARDEIARILEQVAKEGLDHPRDLDAAIDAIGAAFNAEPMKKVIDSYLDAKYWIDRDDDPVEMFGEGATAIPGYFVPVQE